MDAQTTSLFLSMPAEFYAGVVIGLILGLAGGYYLFSKSIRFFQDQVKHLKDELSREIQKNERLNNFYAQSLIGLSSQKKARHNQADDSTDTKPHN